MRTGRPTDDKKMQTLRVRVNDDLMSNVQDYANRRDKTVSEIVRNILVEYFSGKQ